MTQRVLAKFLSVLKGWRISVGKDPAALPPGCIIFFPLSQDTLCCGLAGILTIKKKGEAKMPDPANRMSKIFSRVQEGTLDHVLSRKIKTSRYLGGPKDLQELERVTSTLKQHGPYQQLFASTTKTAKFFDLARQMANLLRREESMVEEQANAFSTEDMEIINSRLTLLKDIVWGLEKDILSNLEKIESLSGRNRREEVSPVAFEKYRTINDLLNSLDRLEVRGRDSAGIQISFTLRNKEDLDRVLTQLREKNLHGTFVERTKGGDLLNGSIHVADHRHPDGGVYLSFVYKTASIVGKLGDNVRELREAVRADQILHAFAGEPAVSEIALAHTRWASVGSITEENCHPINSYTLRAPGPEGRIPPAGLCSIPEDIAEKIAVEMVPGMSFYPAYGPGLWTISVVLNGDIDNYETLRSLLESTCHCEIAPEITSDTKIIPLQVERYLVAGKTLEEAFRLAVNDFEGSHAIALASNVEPGKIYLALKGSGQAIFVGLREDQYLFASELYGLVEGTSHFIKMDGEKLRDPAHPESSGQIFVLDQHSEGGLAGIRALTYDGYPVELTESMVQKAEITTRDIDRGNYPHYFLKEISESALSVKKTLRGKYRILEKPDGRKGVVFNLGHDILPDRLLKALRKQIRHIVVIGQGTAAIAGAAIADGLSRYLTGRDIQVEAKKASEMSGFALKEDLRDTLIIAVTQSGTTTDTNRAVAMAGERGASILCIVNRRQSDITTKSHGVFYTSDGRDIEMSVASTKAFYSQIVAGYTLGLCLAQFLKTRSDDFIAGELLCLEKAPDLMNRVLERKDDIRASAEKLAKTKKYWAVVGNGPNKASADEIRIKLSELCYKTISSDFIEDKKHIDLSSEPLILVCAAGNPGTVTGDVIKDTAIFKAHKASVVVFADEGETRFDGIADSVIRIPRAAMPLPVILNTLAGHLWGYFAASSIDDDAAFFRGFRNELSLAVVEQDHRNYTLYQRILDRNLHRVVKDFSAQFNERKNRGVFTLMNARTMTDISLLTKYVAGKLPLEDFWSDFGEGGGNASPVDLLNIAFGHAIDELSRPIDAIRHQAKTVTVGTSRKEEILRGVLFDLVAILKFSAKNLKAENILDLDRIQKAVAGVRGYTLYEIGNLDAEGGPTDDTTISIVKRGGIALEMKSRVEKSKMLMGAKRSIVSVGHLYIGRGKTDGASIIIVPLLGEGPGVRHLLLIHIQYNEALSLSEKIDVLGSRFNDIRNLVNEYNLPWSDRYLESISLESIFSEPVEIIAGQIRTQLNA